MVERMDDHRKTPEGNGALSAVTPLSKADLSTVAHRVFAMSLATVPRAHAAECADEVFQETCTRLLGCPIERHTVPFALGIAKNVIKEVLRASRKRRMFTGAVTDAIVEEVVDVETEIRSQLVTDCIEQLTPKQKVVIQQFFFDDVRLNQIAHSESCTSPAISDRLHRALQGLRDCLEYRGLSENDVE